MTVGEPFSAVKDAAAPRRRRPTRGTAPAACRSVAVLLSKTVTL